MRNKNMLGLNANLDINIMAKCQPRKFMQVNMTCHHNLFVAGKEPKNEKFLKI